MAPPLKRKASGFTLVELAIVLMIIGLLIGGILKGQELIQNARINTFIRTLKAYDAATLTFVDSYGALPGDIANPSARLPNCSTAKCNVAGNGDGSIGAANAYADENLNYWIHLAAANLISGINMNATWTASYWVATSPAPETALGGINALYNLRNTTHSMWDQDMIGYYNAGGLSNGAYSVPVNVLMRTDIKADDGLPWKGDYVLNGSFCNIAVVSGAYSSNNTSRCGYLIKTGF